MRSRFGHILAFTFLAAIVALGGCQENKTPDANGTTNGGLSNDSRPALRFSAIPDQSKTELKEKFDKLAVYLSDQLDVDVQYVAVTDYKATVDAFKNGDIQLAWFGGLTGVQARAAVSGAHAIAQGKSDPHFQSYFIAHKDTKLEAADGFPQTLGEFTFTFGSESSTSGRLMPEFYIRQHTKQSPHEFFAKAPTFSGSHDLTVELVESGQIQSGVVNFMVYDKRVAEQKTDPNVCRVIWKTPEYADYNFTAHPDLETIYGTGFTDKLQSVLIGISDQELLDAFPRESLIEATNEDFVGIEAVAKELGFLK